MKLIAIALVILNVAFIVATIPNLDASQFETKKRESATEQADHVTTDHPIHPIYLSTLNNNNPPPALHPYPTYPEYLSNGRTVRLQFENEDRSKMLVPQKSSQWSPRNIISSLVPIVNSMILYGTRTSIVVMQFLLIALMGAGLISLVCTYTTICSINFLGLNKYNVKDQVTELARAYITPESLRMASLLVGQAIDKYSAENEKEKYLEKDVTKEASAKLIQ